MKQLLVRLAQWVIKTFSDQSYKGATFTVYRLGDYRARIAKRPNFTKDFAIEAGGEQMNQVEMLKELMKAYPYGSNSTSRKNLN